MIVFRAKGGRAALAEAKRRGRGAQHRYKNGYGDPVYFELVGVLDLLELGIECEKDEVWYRLVERVKPMERRTRILPQEKNLSAIQWSKVLTRACSGRRSRAAAEPPSR